MKAKYSDFSDVQHAPLRAYNRAVTAFNIREDLGSFSMMEYLEQFSKEDRLRSAQVTALTKKMGVKWVKEQVTKGLVFSDEDYKEVV